MSGFPLVVGTGTALNASSWAFSPAPVFPPTGTWIAQTTALPSVMPSEVTIGELDPNVKFGTSPTQLSVTFPPVTTR